MKNIYRILICSSLLALISIVSCNRIESVEDAPKYLHISSIVPAKGTAGGYARISGSNFKEGVVVQINGKEAKLNEVDPDYLVITLPDNPLGEYPVKVVSGDEEKSDISFTYIEESEIGITLANVTPKKGYVGEEITIYGDGFSDNKEDMLVTIGGVEASVTYSSRTIVSVVTPENPEGPAPIVVHMGDLVASGYNYEYLHIPTLSILDVVPNSGSKGDLVTLTGECFSPMKDNNILTIGGKAVTVQEATDTQLKVVMPDLPMGDYTFSITVGDKTVEQGEFEYVAQKYYMSVLAGDGGSTILNGPQDIDFYDNGNKLWIVDRGNHRVRSFDLSTNIISTIVDDNPLLEGKFPWQGSFDSKGDFYVACKAGGYITKITKAGVCEKYTISGLDKNLNNPMTVDFDSNDNMYIADRSNNRVVKVVGGTYVKSYTVPSPETVEIVGDKAFCGSLGYKLHMINLVTDEVVAIAGTGSKPTTSTVNEGEASKVHIGIIDGITVDDVNNIIYFTDNPMMVVRKLVADENGDYSKGVVSTIVGTPFGGDFTVGVDALSAKFKFPQGIALDDDGETLYLTAGPNTNRLLKLYLD